MREQRDRLFWIKDPVSGMLMQRIIGGCAGDCTCHGSGAGFQCKKFTGREGGKTPS